MYNQYSHVNHNYIYTQEKRMIALQRKNKVFQKEEGPFVHCLDEALASFNVERQAYYSGTFVGNHVHRALKVV